MNNKIEQPSVQIYTGEGKGKSTAAFGLAMRAAGNGFRVLVIQFQKARECGERIGAEKLGIELMHCPHGRGHGACAVPCPLLAAAGKALEIGETDLLILDEIMAAIKHGCVGTAEAALLIDTYRGKAEIVMTGRNAPEELTSRADLVTEMKKIKHYYDAGLPARRGIEF